MKIENLTEGMVIKNYKELCSVLEMRFYTGGNAKASQIKELERYCEFHKEGNKIIIDEIFGEVKEKVDMRKEGNAGIYSEDVQKLILDLLAKQDDERISLSINMLFKELQMVNSNYSVAKNNTLEASKVLKIDEKVIQDFYGYTQRKLKTIVVTALNKLQDKALIMWNTSMWVAEREVNMVMNEMNKPKLDGDKVIYDLNTIYREATKEEEKLILRVRGEMLDKFKCKEISEVMSKGIATEFFNAMNKVLGKEANILFSYDCYNILQNSERVKDELLGRFERTNTYNKLNFKIKETSKLSIDKRHSNSKEKVEGNNCGKWTEETHNLRAKEEYPMQAKKLSDKVLDRKSRDISRKIEAEKKKSST